MTREAAVCALLSVLVWAHVRAQAPEPAQPVFRAGVALVEVAAVVLDSNGSPVADLTASDFEILEDGVARPLVSVRRLVAGQRNRAAATVVEGAHVESLVTNTGLADAPAFVLVLDDLNTSPFDAHRAIRAGLGLLGAIPDDGLVAVVTTSGVGGQLLTLTPPGPEHAERVRAFRGRVLLAGAKDRSYIQTTPSSVNAPCGVGSAVPNSQDCGDPTRAARRANVIEAVAQILSRAGSRRKVVFWVTEDMGVSPLDPHGNRVAQKAALERVLNADVAIYPVNPREGHADMRMKAVVSEGDRGDNRPDRRTGGLLRFGVGDTVFGGSGGTTIELNTDDMVGVTLGQVARESGGRWITAANDLDTLLAEVVEQNTSSYILAFEASGTQTPGRHQIDVRVRRDDVRVFARRAYVVPDVATPVEPTASESEAVRLLRETAFGSVPQGQLTMQMQVVPSFATGRDGSALVTVRVDAASAGDEPVDLALLTIDDDGNVSAPQMFRMTPAPGEAAWEVTTSMPLTRGAHQVRAAAVTADATRVGLVMAPVAIVEAGNDLLMAPPVVLEMDGDAGATPTLKRRFDVGTPVGLQAEVAGRAVRDETARVVVSFRDVEGRVARETDAVLQAGEHNDRQRATAVMHTAGLAPGSYTLVVDARRAEADANPVRHALALTLEAPAVPVHTADPAPTTAHADLNPIRVAYGPETTHESVGPLVIRDEAAWTAFWLHLPTSQTPPPIDFARVTLLAFVIDGDSTAPVQPVVDRIQRMGDTAVVHWRTAAAPRDPASSTPGTRPFVVVGIVGHDGPVRFEPLR